VKEQRYALCRRIRSVKSWLSRAEKNFDDADDMRGELNLLLAEAELQRLRETEGKKSARRGHVMAAALAAGIVFISWTAWDVLQRPGRQHGAAEVSAKESAGAQHIERKEEKPVLAAAEAEPPAAQVSREEEPAPVTAASAPEKGESVFSESDLRDFVRTAGKALRSNI
jgi:hypothetical protein